MKRQFKYTTVKRKPNWTKGYRFGADEVTDVVVGSDYGSSYLGVLISENQISYEVLLDCAADGEGNEYVIVHLPKINHRNILATSHYRMGQIYGSHSITQNMLSKHNRSSAKKHKMEKQ